MCAQDAERRLKRHSRDLAETIRGNIARNEDVSSGWREPQVETEPLSSVSYSAGYMARDSAWPRARLGYA